MKAPLSLLVGCLLIVLAALGYGVWERNVGAQQAEARARADSLLNASKLAQDSIQRADSLAAVRYTARLDSLSRVLGASRALYARSRGTVDSLISATRSDSVVPRDTVIALVAAFRGERAAADSQIALLAQDTVILGRRVAQQDSVIRALGVQLGVARDGWAQALKPISPGLLARGADLVVKGLALYGAVRLLGH